MRALAQRRPRYDDTPAANFVAYMEQRIIGTSAEHGVRLQLHACEQRQGVGDSVLRLPRNNGGHWTRQSIAARIGGSNNIRSTAWLSEWWQWWRRALCAQCEHATTDFNKVVADDG